VFESIQRKQEKKMNTEQELKELKEQISAQQKGGL
jgi:hypothetical protein